jgi:hypothetical protein
MGGGAPVQGRDAALAGRPQPLRPQWLLDFLLPSSPRRRLASQHAAHFNTRDALLPRMP